MNVPVTAGQGKLTAGAPETLLGQLVTGPLSFATPCKLAAEKWWISPAGNGGGGGGGNTVAAPASTAAACARIGAPAAAPAAAAVLNVIFRSTRVLAVATLLPTAATDAADGVGNDAKLNVAEVALNACPAGAGAPLMDKDATPELVTPEVDKKILYGPQRTPKFCSYVVTLSGKCGINVNVAEE